MKYGNSTVLSAKWLVVPASDVGYLHEEVPPKDGVPTLTWTETFNCDICGKQKSTVDHWWLAWSEPFSPHAQAGERQMLKIYPWENMLAHDSLAKHLCGQACLQKLVDRWLNVELGNPHAAASHPGK